jgi:Glycosyltransferase
MKIAFFIFHLKGGGAERVICTLANHFTEENHNVEIISVSEEPSFYNLNEKVNHVKLGIKYYGFLKKINFINTIKSLYLNLRKTKPDVLVSFIDKNNLMAIVVGKMLNIPVIISERSNPEKYSYGIVLTYLLKLLYKKANLIVLQTKAVGQGFIRMGFDLPAIAVLPNPLTPIFAKNQPTTEKKKNIILSVGRLSLEKGHDVLLKSLVGNNLNGWEVKIVGDGPLLPQYREYANHNGLSTFVSFEGRRSNVIDYYDEAKVFILPSKFEGFPNALIEAMSRRCLVVSSNCEYGPSEIINNNINGVLFPVGDVDCLRNCIERICNNNYDIKQLSDNALLTAKRYHINEISKEWMEVIQRVVKC